MKTTLAGFKSWEKQRLHEYKTPTGIVRVVVEYNPHHGDLIRFFEIGGTTVSTVRCRHTGKLLQFDASNSLIGERDFENGSIVYEFLLKPLGIDTNNHQVHTCCGVMYSSFYEFDQQMKRYKV